MAFVKFPFVMIKDSTHWHINTDRSDESPFILLVNLGTWTDPHARFDFPTQTLLL